MAEKIASSSATTPNPIIRTLYRGLMKEATHLDKEPVLKVLMPMPKHLQESLRLANQLYTPNSGKYADLVRSLFRGTTQLAGPAKMEDPAKLKIAFEGLNTLRQHRSALQASLPRITQDRAPLIKALSKAQEEYGSRYSAEVVNVPRITAEKLKTQSSTRLSTTSARNAVMKREGFDLKPGMGLIAHPLSSAHIDRRVMIITEKTAQLTTGLVLDMLYTYPLSHGNPMFPEVLWQHEVYNGGYCHVDYTMPPTANCSILHTLPPPAVKTAAHQRFLSWATGVNPSAASANEHHELLCKPLIEGTTNPETGVKTPTLYYSRVEALPYLSTIAPGQPRSALRVYWGCMKWPTSQLITEISTGHWIPVQLSSEFFAAYPVNRPSQGKDSETGKELSTAMVDCFPTEADLLEARNQRKRHLGADLTTPQTFPPDQPMCRREALWDQVLYSLGGEYREMVGAINPFAQRSDLGRVPPIVPLPGDASSSSLLDAEAANLAVPSDDDDEEEEEDMLGEDEEGEGEDNNDAAADAKEEEESEKQQQEEDNGKKKKGNDDDKKSK